MRGKTIGIIGVGNMGGAIVHGILTAGLFRSEDIVVYDAVSQKTEAISREHGLNVVSGAADVARRASTIIIAVKPQNMKDCLKALNGAAGPSHLIISVAAGITTESIEAGLGGNVRVVRVMPNTPALVAAGTSAICSGARASDEDVAAVEEIFAALGKVYRVDESMMDAVTAVSGSGPAYLFLFAECMERAALKVGLPEHSAAGIVANTLFGASKLLVESGESASALRAKVTSPGGTTEAAVRKLGERDFEGSIIAAVSSAHARARELGGIKGN